MKRSMCVLLVAGLAQPAFAQPGPAAGGGPAASDPTKPADPAAVPAAPVNASSDDIDLSSLGLAPGAPAFDDKINIYGFADISWANTHFTKSSPLVKDTTSFTTGSLNLYAAKNLAPNWRSLAEIRFMYVPNGSTNQDGTVQITTAADPTNFSRPIEWGTISIERAYIEYDLHPLLTVRIGHWLTPYGIWNIDHGSPAIISVFRPYTIGEAVFPEHQTGLDLFGSAPIADCKISYHATVSNGRSPTEMIVDTDRKPAFGGRLELEAPWAGTLKIGASAYAGRYTGATTSFTMPTEQYDETALAADAQWDHGGLHVQAELMGRQRSYIEGHRPFTPLGTLLGDGKDIGGYGLIGYRSTALWNVMPFAFYEDYRPLVTGLIGSVKAMNVGLNFRPVPTVVLKVHGAYAWGDGTGLIDSKIYVVTSQIAWVF